MCDAVVGNQTECCIGVAVVSERQCVGNGDVARAAGVAVVDGVGGLDGDAGALIDGVLDGAHLHDAAGACSAVGNNVCWAGASDVAADTVGDGDVRGVEQPVFGFDAHAMGRQVMAGGFDETTLRFELCTAHIAHGGENVGVFVPANVDVAAGCAVVAVGFDAAAQPDQTPISQEVDRPSLLACGVDAARLDDLRRRAVQSQRLHVDLPALGDDAAGVADVRVHVGGGQFELDAAGAAHRHFDRVGCTQEGVAPSGVDLALVADAGTQQGHIAAGGGGDSAFIHDAGGAAVALINHVARHEVGV